MWKWNRNACILVGLFLLLLDITCDGDIVWDWCVPLTKAKAWYIYMLKVNQAHQSNSNMCVYKL